MSEENVALVRRFFEAANQGGLDAVTQFWDPDVVFHEDSTFLEGGVYRGRDTVVRYFQGLMESWAEYRFEIEELRDLGERVLALCHERGRGKGSGVEVDVHSGWIITLQDGIVLEMSGYFDRADALRALELDP